MQAPANTIRTGPFSWLKKTSRPHGRKSWFDRTIETDPGLTDFSVAADYQEHPPAVIAVLPFGDLGDANFTIDKIPITFRNKEEQERFKGEQKRYQDLILKHAGEWFNVEKPYLNDISVRIRTKPLPLKPGP